jgi:hypothetical protein
MTKPSLLLIKRCRSTAASTLNILDEEAASASLGSGSLKDGGTRVGSNMQLSVVFWSPSFRGQPVYAGISELKPAKMRLFFPPVILTMRRGPAHPGTA